jgi:hypothetical protein
MEIPDYNKLIESGQIKDFDDLMLTLRKDLIDTYKSRSIWPKYTLTPADADWIRVYIMLDLQAMMDFNTFVSVVNARNEM